MRASWQDVAAVAESMLEKRWAFLQPQLAEMLSHPAVEEGYWSEADHYPGRVNSTNYIPLLYQRRRSWLRSWRLRSSLTLIMLEEHRQTLHAVEAKLADLEDRNRRCNIRVIGLPERVKGSNATQYLTRSLPKWFPTLDGCNIEIMRAHRIYRDNGSYRGANHTLIFNTQQYLARQAILLKAWISSSSTRPRWKSRMGLRTRPSLLPVKRRILLGLLWTRARVHPVLWPTFLLQAHGVLTVSMFRLSNSQVCLLSWLLVFVLGINFYVLCVTMLIYAEL